ncbi:hypothetical protein [Actinomadura miaoliensis]|uniref:Uncharacterized protein n=1 Tax=Actinomadura miaoliensis TaxID=430685 RepID=A0ABP7UXT2_9ACTN
MRAFLYASTGVLVTARLLRHPPRPGDLIPPYWVAMGATAISVLSGTKIGQMAGVPAADAVRPLSAAVSVAFWAFGTWLIPALVATGWWRHITRRP